MANCYVKAYFDWIEQTAALSDAEKGRLFIAVLEYARSGLEPNLDGRESILFPVFRVTIDRDAKRAVASAENGKTGGRPKTKKNLTEPNFGEENLTRLTEDRRQKTKDRRQKTEELSPPLYPPAGGGFSPKLQEAVDSWMRYKAEKRQPYKPTGQRALMAEIKHNAEIYGDDAVAELIRKCMSANWQGIIFDRLKKEQGAKGGGDKNAWMDDYTG